MPVEAQVLMSESPSSSCLANISFPAASKVADLSPHWPSINIWIQDPLDVRKAGEQISREMYTEMCSIGRVVTPVGTWYQSPTMQIPELFTIKCQEEGERKGDFHEHSGG